MVLTNLQFQAECGEWRKCYIIENVPKDLRECPQTFRGNSKRYNNDLKVPIRNSVTFGDKSVRVLGPHIWNMLPTELKCVFNYRVWIKVY